MRKNTIKIGQNPEAYETSDRSRNSIDGLKTVLMYVSVGGVALISGVLPAHASPSQSTIENIEQVTESSAENTGPKIGKIATLSTISETTREKTDKQKLIRMRKIRAKKAKIRCAQQLKLDKNQFSSCQYTSVYRSFSKNKKKNKWLKSHRLREPGKDRKIDRQKLYFKTHPEAYYNFQLENMSTKQAAITIWTKEFGWSKAEVQAGFYIIRRESPTMNPCQGFGEPSNITCAETKAWNGKDVPCGIPQLKPCRYLGDKLEQLRAFVRYAESSRYGSVFIAAAHKRRFGWY